MFNRKEYMKQWHEKNPEYMNKYRIANKEKIKKQVKICYGKWYKNNPSYMKEYMRNYDRKEYMKEYRNNNIEKTKKYRKEWWMTRYRTDLKFKLSNNISRAIRRSLRGNKAGRHWESLVGYTHNDLIKRLKKTMPKGYDWQDFLQGKLHIDHKIPMSAFNFTKPEHSDFKKCWVLKNLQLLPAEENIMKSNHLSRPFQPALQI